MVIQEGYIDKGTGKHQSNTVYSIDGVSPAICHGGEKIKQYTYIMENLRIRKLTPRECWRLMGRTDTDFEKAESVCSDSQLYKQAGNSIVVDVLVYLFAELFRQYPIEGGKGNETN